MDADDTIVIVFAALAAASLLGAIRALTRRPRRTGLAVFLILLALLLGYGSYFWATFQIRMF